MISTFQIIVVFEVTIIIHASTLSEMATKYVPHLNLHLVSDTSPEDLTNVANIYYASFYNDTQITPAEFQSKNYLQRSENFFTSVRSILNLDSSNMTLEVLNLIGLSSDVRSNNVFPAYLVIWPDLIDNSSEAESIMEAENFQQATQNFNIASELIIAFETKNNEDSNNTGATLAEKYLFYETYNINLKQVVHKIDDGLIYFNCKQCRGEAIRRRNFHGVRINIAGVQDPEANDDLHIHETAMGDIYFSKDGFSAKILEILQTSLNFTYKAIKSDHWGFYDSNKQAWTGSIADVTTGVADIGIASTFMQPDRAEVVSFFPPTDENHVAVYFYTPNVNAVRDIFARPFKADLWAAVFSTWIILAVFMYMFSLIRKRYGLDLEHEDGNPEPDFTQDSFIWALATACQQGWDEHPVAGSLRTIFISASFTGVVAYAGYSAAIVSTLSLRVDPIQNAQELLKSNLKVGIREGFISNILDINGTKDIMSQFQEKLKKSDASEQHLNIEHGYNRLLRNSYAFISTRDNIYDYLKMNANDTAICSMREMRLLAHGFPTGHFSRKNSPYKEFFRYVYVEIREPGVLWKLRTNFTYQRRCLEASDNAGNALGANDVFTAFMILVGGLALSITFLVIEKMINVKKAFEFIR